MGVNNGIPNGMEVLGGIFDGESEEVATKVTLRVLAVDSGGGVEWLMDVTNIVDQKSECVGSCLLLIRHVLFHGFVNEGVLIARFV